MHLDLWTLLLQAINLAVLLALLRWLLYRPLLAMIDKRRQHVVDEMAKAQAAQQTADELAQSLEAQRTALEAQREQVLNEAWQQVGTEREALLAQARTAARSAQAEARQQLEKERQQAGQALIDEASSLAIDLATRLLAQSPTPPGDAEFIDALLDHLAATPATERQSWLGDATPPDITLVCASEPGEATLQHARQRLSQDLGMPVKLQARTDPALLRGAELHFPHGALALNWSAELAAARAEMQQAGRASP
jgi:F-type H+-transporting ATPase subunit b